MHESLPILSLRVLTELLLRPREMSPILTVYGGNFGPTELWRVKAIKKSIIWKNGARGIDHGTILNRFLFRLVFQTVLLCVCVCVCVCAIHV
jgi:hypothetical protein